MKTPLHSLRIRSAGFTLVEIVIATALSMIAIAAVMVVFSYGSILARAGAYQAHFTRKGREVAQKAARYVEMSQGIAAVSNGLELVAVDQTHSRLIFDDGDGDISTVKDNAIVYDADLSAAGDEIVLCRYVSPIGNEPMLSLIPSNPITARLCFHVGDGTNTGSEAFSETGLGYQGLEVRVSVTPRNRTMFFQ